MFAVLALSYWIEDRTGRRSKDSPDPRVRPRPQQLADALTFCDMTTSPGGEHVQVHSRLAEIHARYNTGHLVSRSIPLIL